MPFVSGTISGAQTGRNARNNGSCTFFHYASPYDASWPTTTISPDGGETTTTYNQLGWVTGTTDQRGVAHTYTYGGDKDPAAGQVTLDAVASFESPGTQY